MTLQLTKDLSIFDRNLTESDNESDSDEELVINQNISVKNPFFSREKVIVNDKFCKIIDIHNKELRYNFNNTDDTKAYWSDLGTGTDQTVVSIDAEL